MAEEALRRIGELYALEAEVAGAHAADRLALRQREALPRLRSLHARANKLRPAQVREFRTKEVLVREIDTGEHWLITYTAINLDGVDVSIRDNRQRGLSRHEVAIGDTVGFLDHEHRQRSGQIVRLNDKTVTLNAEGQKWRVAYALLHRVLNSSKVQTINGELIKR